MNCNSFALSAGSKAQGDGEMGNQDDDFKARAKRVRVQSMQSAPIPARRRVNDDDFDAKATRWAVLRPQLALILGAVALVVGRAIAMNFLGIEPSTELLGLGEGGVVILLLVVIGLLLGKSQYISHAALVIGASLAFLGEGYYIPIIPKLMESVYSPGYVALVVINAQ